MISVHKDVLRFLEIDCVYLSFLSEKPNCFCMPVKVGYDYWIVASDVDIADEKAKLNVKFKNIYLELPVTVKRKGRKIYRSDFVDIERNRPKSIADLFGKIAKLEADQGIWNKRKEERYAVGLENALKIKFKTAEQSIISEGKRIPCLVNDLSFTGANITGFYEKTFVKDAKAGLVLEFNDPVEGVILKASIRNIVCKEEENKACGAPVFVKRVFAILSLEFLETPLSYKQRLGRFIEEMEKGIIDG